MFRVFKVVETDPLGIKVKKEYLAIKGRLEERYGKRTKKYERSTKDIMWSRPDWFMRSLRYDKRMHASVWSFNSGDGFAAVTLEIDYWHYINPYSYLGMIVVEYVGQDYKRIETEIKRGEVERRNRDYDQF